jgi:hypothetical protein
VSFLSLSILVFKELSLIFSPLRRSGGTVQDIRMQFFFDDLVLPLFAPILLNLPGDIDKNDPTEPGPFKREIRAIGPQFSAKTVQLGRSFQENVSFLE